MLLEVFPTCSVEQAQWALAKARGDLEEAVQMLVESKEEGPPGWDGPNQVTPFGPAPVYLLVKTPPLPILICPPVVATGLEQGSHVCRTCPGALEAPKRMN